MLIQKKSGIEKFLNTAEKTSAILGASLYSLDRASKIIRPLSTKRGRSPRFPGRFGWLFYLVPIIWANRARMKKAADSVLQKAQQRLEASKRAMSGAQEQQPQEEEKQQEQKQAEQGNQGQVA